MAILTQVTQLWNEWEIQFLVLLSFTLQVIVFFGGGLRRHSRNSALRLLIWLVYLLADFVVVYALGYLSRHESAAPGVAVGQMHQLAFFWIPFLLIHLGGQDTITAFSIEDNELWLRHLLNLLVQVCLGLYVFWKSAAHNQFLVPAIFAFVAGIIKYGERTWALKCASQKSLSGSTNGEAVQFPKLENEQELDYYLTTAMFALSSAPIVRNLFVGRKLEQMDRSLGTSFTNIYGQVSDGLVFKILEMEVGMMYDSLYTKAPVIRTWAGAILRCFTHISLLVAFVLFLTRNKQWLWHYSRVDVAITYTLFIGAFCLEVCAIFFTVVMSPYTWAFFQSRKFDRLARAAWYIFKSVRPESKPWWSNSMGQYNFLSSCFSDKVVGKMMDLVGAKELWRNFRHAKHVDFRTDTKKLIFESKYLAETFRANIVSTPDENPTSRVCAAALESLDMILRLRKPFEEVILSLHVYTDIFLHRCMNPPSIASWDITRETRHLMDECRRMSEYMLYLLAVHPAMLPVSSSVRDVLEKASETVAKVSSTAPSKGKFLEKLATDRDLNDTSDPVQLAGSVFRGLEEEAVHSHETWEVLLRAWVGLLLYAAGKSRGEVHAKQLSMGGELLTFVWLHMAHRGLGDMGRFEIELIRPSGVYEGGRKMFVWCYQRPQ